MTIVNFIKNRLPVSRKTYLEDMAHMLQVIGGLLESDEQHSQLEMTFIQEIQTLKLNTLSKKQPKTPTNSDPAFN